ncbi:MAG: prolipoprotein diacylglyceryl transferase [Anaerolineales bacterium]
MTIDSYGIHLGFLYIRFYGILLMLGALAGAVLSRRMMRWMGRDPEVIWDALLWVLVFGIIGARLYHVLTPSRSLLEKGIDTAYYLTHPLDILMIWQGGLGMPGAIAGGLVGLWIFARRARVPLPILMDAATPAVALGQAIGRWGNFINQELYGPPTNLPWAIPIRPENRLPGYESFERFHPLFLYESIWNLANTVFLVWLWRRYHSRMQTGDLFLVYLITYPMGRFLLEFIRLDYVPLMGLNLNQALMLVLAVGSGIALYLRSRRAPARKPV